MKRKLEIDSTQDALKKIKVDYSEMDFKNACKCGDTQIVETYLRSNLVISDVSLHVSLVTAINNNHVGVVKLLLKYEEINPAYENNWPFQTAYSKNNAVIMNLLINHEKLNLVDLYIDLNCVYYVIANNINMKQQIFDHPKLNALELFKKIKEGIPSLRNLDPKRIFIELYKDGILNFNTKKGSDLLNNPDVIKYFSSQLQNIMTPDEDKKILLHMLLPCAQKHTFFCISNKMLPELWKMVAKNLVEIEVANIFEPPKL